MLYRPCCSTGGRPRCRRRTDGRSPARPDSARCAEEPARSLAQLQTVREVKVCRIFLDHSGPENPLRLDLIEE
ncbi:hypothetical protein LDENG_00180670 [Lucifuga dentata]|nr:hypothetical protein LDENG_00180670 [Lucifuga dentata]